RETDRNSPILTRHLSQDKIRTGETESGAPRRFNWHWQGSDETISGGPRGPCRALVRLMGTSLQERCRMIRLLIAADDEARWCGVASRFAGVAVEVCRDPVADCMSPEAFHAVVFAGS